MRVFYVVSLSILLFVSCAQRVPESVKVAHSEKAMVSAAHPLATETGLEVLRQGGNAMDAAVAVAFSLAVVYPRAGNLGGGGFMVYRDASGEVRALDFRERAPQGAFRDMYLDADGNVKEGASLNGALAVGVPGSIAGLIEAHRLHGSLPLKDLVEPAVRQASHGFQITAREANRLNKYRQNFLEHNNPNIPFIKPSAWHEGDVLKQPELAKTLKKIGQDKGHSFYHGEMAKALSEFLRSKGGIITSEDLSNYQPDWKTPQTVEYKQYTVHCMPLPSSGGIALSQILTTLKNYNLTSPHSVKDVHLLSEIERRAYADRASHLGDPEYVDVPTRRLLSPAYLKQRMSDFSETQATKSQSIQSGDFDIDLESFETTHLSIHDQVGNTVSLTTTLNSNYGCKLYFPEGGFFLNNEMDDFAIKPGVPNQFGLVGDEANAIAPGKRMLSSMTPTIIEKDSEFFMALGTPGGSTIITSVLQVFLNVAEYGLSLEDAIALPRFHHQWLPDQIYHEPTFSKLVMDTLSEMGHRFQEKEYIGLIDAVMKKSDGTLVGGADPRGDDHTNGL